MAGYKASWTLDAISPMHRPIVASNTREAVPRRAAAPLRAIRLEQQGSAAEQRVHQPARQRLMQPSGNATQQGSDRRAAAAAAAAALAGSGAACYAALSAQPQLPPLEDVLMTAASVLLGGPLLALAAAKAALRDRLHVELHRWMLSALSSLPQPAAGLSQGLSARLFMLNLVVPCISRTCIHTQHT